MGRLATASSFLNLFLFLGTTSEIKNSYADGQDSDMHTRDNRFDCNYNHYKINIFIVIFSLRRQLQ